MFNEQGILQSCFCGDYSMSYPVNQCVYNTSYNTNVYQNYVYPVGAFDNVYESTIALNNLLKRQEDEKDIENFLLDVERSNNVNDQKDICRKSKIAMTKNAIASAYKLNERLNNICEELKENQGLTEEEWKEKMSICNAAKEEIVKLLAPIRDEGFMNQLKKDLERRKKKRQRERLKKEKWRCEKAMKMERRGRLHTEIDSWIRKEQAVIDKEKQDENLRKDADLILSDVRGKRTDARKYLGLVQELRNLRNVKANVARARGEKLSSAADEAFNNIVAKLTEQWTILDREYSIEEQGLKLMLKTDNEERIEKQKKSNFDEWEKVLFGKTITVDQYNVDLSSFVAIRTAWDKYISSENDASPIPIGWVMPDKPSSAAWQNCLKKELF